MIMLEAPGGYVVSVRPFNPRRRMYEIEFEKIGRFSRSTLTTFRSLVGMAKALSAILVVRISNKETRAIKLAEALGLKPRFKTGGSTTYMTC